MTAVRVLCSQGDRPCNDNDCRKCRGWGSVRVTGWRAAIIRRLVGL